MSSSIQTTFAEIYFYPWKSFQMFFSFTTLLDSRDSRAIITHLLAGWKLAIFQEIYHTIHGTGSSHTIYGTGIFTYIWLIFMMHVGKYTRYTSPMDASWGFLNPAKQPKRLPPGIFICLVGDPQANPLFAIVTGEGGIRIEPCKLVCGLVSNPEKLKKMSRNPSIFFFSERPTTEVIQRLELFTRWAQKTAISRAIYNCTNL